jgi:DNA-binding MarR family transcriptional regulator
MPASESVRLFALLHAAGALESQLESRLSTAGLSIAKLAALRQLTLAGGSLALGQQAERLWWGESNLNQHQESLEGDGLVSRTAEPHDRRSRLAVVTPAGRDAYEQGSAIHRQAEQELLGVLDEPERADLARLLAKLDPRC